MRHVINQARKERKKIVFSEGEEPTIIKAASQCLVEGICDPILGHPERIEAVKEELAL